MFLAAPALYTINISPDIDIVNLSECNLNGNSIKKAEISNCAYSVIPSNFIYDNRSDLFLFIF